MKVGKTFQPGLLSTCEGGFQGTLMVLLDTMGRFYNRNSLTPRHLKTYWQCTGLRVVLHKRYISQDKVSYHLLRSRIYTEGRPRLVLGRVFSQRKWSFHVDWRRLGCHVRWCSSLHPMSKKNFLRGLRHVGYYSIISLLNCQLRLCNLLAALTVKNF